MIKNFSSQPISKNNKIMQKDVKNITKIFALGGLEEVGKNTYCIERNNQIIIIDAGLKFPEKSLLGVQSIIPDYKYLIDNQHKIKALFITHGHEDHIGAIPFLLKKVKVPKIYSPKFASDLIALKLKKFPTRPPIIEFNEKKIIQIQDFFISFFAVTHSIPNSFGLFVKTPDGTIAVTGDFKLDWTPLGQKTSIYKIIQAGKAGVDLLLSDSTNSEFSGYNLSEKRILKNIEFLILKNQKRILITTFASNFNRIFWIIKICQKVGKKVLILGKAIQNIIQIVIQRGYFALDKKIFIKEEEINHFNPNEVVIICTGSQGEPSAIISKIADSRYSLVRGNEEDLVIFSSRPIPGNAYNLENIINKLQKKGVEVHVSSPENELHTSGHARQEEQKVMVTLMQPTYFMPVHGEYRMLKIHGQTAIDVGIKRENVFVCRNGDQIFLQRGKAWKGDYFPVPPVYIGKRYQSEDSMKILRERQLMLQSGIVSLIFSVDLKTKKIIKPPKFIIRGSFFAQKEAHFMQKLSQNLTNLTNDYLSANVFNERELKQQMEKKIINLIYEEKKIYPLIHITILTKN